MKRIYDTDGPTSTSMTLNEMIMNEVEEEANNGEANDLGGVFCSD
jgi:hypothetical protein